MTGMTPERLDAIRANLPTPDADLRLRALLNPTEGETL